MNLIEEYKRQIEKRNYTSDSSQEAAVRRLNDIGRKLMDYQSSSPVYRWLRQVTRSESPIDGMYLWGGVGRGKTFIVDLFMDCLPIDKKVRMHFHRFMHWVHDELKARQGEENPLRAIAEEFASETCVICFDEFFVSDITDAMILGELFKVLFENGVTLVATSNIPPQELYSNGLQRERFLPAIDSIVSHCLIHNLDSGTDYRLRHLEKAELYYDSCGTSATEKLLGHFNQLAPNEEVLTDVSIEIEGRDIGVKALSDDIVWFAFEEICIGPRNAADYIEIAKMYHTVFVSEVLCMDDSKNDAMRRFISMIDEFYDRKVKLFIAAYCDIDTIYTGSGLAFEFERTKSRLVEMQSKDYLALAHIP